MTDNNQFTKILTALGAILAMAALAGCCHECENDKDIFYSFDIPADQSNCPAGTTFTDVSGGVVDNLGGSGIVDRGGSGIVDRSGNRVKKFCYEPCVAPELPIGSAVYPIWNSPSQFIVASSNCALPEGIN